MNEFILAILGFAIGIVSTLITQVLIRRFQIGDARQKLKIEHLEIIRRWINAYQELFKCRYPQVKELVLAKKYFDPNYGEFLMESGGRAVFEKDKTLSSRVYNALQEYRKAEIKYIEAERQAIPSLHALGASPYILYSRKKPTLEGRIREKLGWYPSASKALSKASKSASNSQYFQITSHIKLDTPKGFIGEIAPYLETLLKCKQKIYVDFLQSQLVHIDWDIFETIDPQNVGKAIKRTPSYEYPRFPDNPNNQEEWEHFKVVYKVINESHNDEDKDFPYLMDELSQVRYYAEKALENTITIIDNYKNAWLTPSH